MGNYNGGGTIISRGQFGSYDPADNANLSRSTKKTSGGKLKKPKKPKKPKKIKKFLNEEQLLNNAIDQILSKSDLIKLPQNLPPSLKARIEAIGGLLIWAEAQPNFGAIKVKKVKKKQAQESVIETGKTSGFTVVLLQKKGVKRAISPQEKENIGEGEAGIIPEDRERLMGSLIHQILSGAKELKIPIGNTPVLNEVRAAPTPLKWLEAQPDYTELRNKLAKFKENFEKKSKKKKELKNNLPGPVVPKEDSSSLTSRQISLRGKVRTKIHSTYKDNHDVVFLKVGILPPVPTLVRGWKKKQVRKTWIGLMDKNQKKAWKWLTAEQRQSYFLCGGISVGFPTKIKPKASNNSNHNKNKKSTVKTLETKK